MGLKCRRQVSDVSITTGFIHSAYLDAGFVDMSTVLNAQLTEFLKSLDVSDRIIGTTIRRAQVRVRVGVGAWPSGGCIDLRPGSVVVLCWNV